MYQKNVYPFEIRVICWSWKIYSLVGINSFSLEIMLVYNVWHLECLLSTYHWEEEKLLSLVPLTGGLWRKEVARLAAVELSASQPYWEGQRNYYSVCSLSPVQAKEYVYLPPGMVETNIKLHYLFKSYNKGWIVNWRIWSSGWGSCRSVLTIRLTLIVSSLVYSRCGWTTQ